MMDSFRLAECNNGFVTKQVVHKPKSNINTNPVTTVAATAVTNNRKINATSNKNNLITKQTNRNVKSKAIININNNNNKPSPILMGTHFTTAQPSQTNSIVTTKYNNIQTPNLINNNFTIVTQPVTRTSLPPPVFINVSPQTLASYGIQGVNSFVPHQTPFTLTTTHTPPVNQTFCAPVGTIRNHNPTNQHPIITIGAPNSIFLPTIPSGAIFGRTATSLGTQVPGTSSISSPLTSSNLMASVPPSSGQIKNRINVPNLFQNFNHFNNSAQLVIDNNIIPTPLIWDYCPGGINLQQQHHHQQQQGKLVKPTKQRKSPAKNPTLQNQPKRTSKKQQRQQNMIISNGLLNSNEKTPMTLPVSEQPSLTENDLVKLMAILNNPAITLTPVTNSTSTDKDTANRAYQPRSGIGCVATKKSSLGNKPSSNLTKQTRAGDATSQPPKSVSNIIQSTMNMARPNLIHGPHTSNQQKSTSNLYAPSPANGGQTRYNKKSIQPFNQSSPASTSIINNNETSFNKPGLTGPAISQNTFMSTSVKNLIMQQPTLGLNLASPEKSISKHLMQHIANHSKESASTQLPIKQNLYYQEYATTSMLSNNDMNNIAIIPSTLDHHSRTHNLDDSQISKVSEWMSQSVAGHQTPSGLFRMDRSYNFGNNIHNDIGGWPTDTNFAHDPINFPTIDIDPLHNVSADPDDIFINRPKRIMSKIDTMVEKRRKRKFEKICQEPITISDKNSEAKNVCEDDEDDSVQDLILDGMPENYDYADVITNQLPLENDLSKEKEQFLSEVGLLSIRAKNALLVEKCCERQKGLRCPKEDICFDDLPERTKRIHNAMLTTRGYDLQMKIGTNFRRNDLSEIEGLDRCSSRIKLTYMNLLGMTKKNKRTALYRVKTANDEGDRLHDFNKIHYPEVSLYHQESTLLNKFKQNLRPQYLGDTDIVDSMVMSSMKPNRLTKSQYMNSLGLSNIKMGMTAC